MSNEPYQAPNVILPNETGEIIDLQKLGPNIIVIFFYPRDNTSSCTKEAKDFSENLKFFNDAGVSIFGISKDSVESHQKFVKKQNLRISLLSDAEGNVCEDFGVWKEKSMYGKTYMGIERSTFIIDKSGIVVKEWRKVKVAGHVDEVMEVIRNF